MSLNPGQSQPCSTALRADLQRCCAAALAVLMERDGSISAIDTTTGQVQQHWPLLFGAEALSESKELHRLSDTHVVAWSNRQKAHAAAGAQLWSGAYARGPQ